MIGEPFVKRKYLYKKGAFSVKNGISTGLDLRVEPPHIKRFLVPPPPTPHGNNPVGLVGLTGSVPFCLQTQY